MSLSLVRYVARVERSDDLHLPRLLILLLAAEGRSKKPLDGIMKLAKLDFLLRYPNCLERALHAAGTDPRAAVVQGYERDTVETRMIRFRYGPWDSRYRRWIGLLVGKGMANTYVKGRTVHIALTDRGREVAQGFGQMDEFSDLHARSVLIVKVVGGKSGSALKDFIYTVFPEVLTMKWGEEISL